MNVVVLVRVVFGNWWYTSSLATWCRHQWTFLVIWHASFTFVTDLSATVSRVSLGSFFDLIRQESDGVGETSWNIELFGLVIQFGHLNTSLVACPW